MTKRQHTITFLMKYATIATMMVASHSISLHAQTRPISQKHRLKHKKLSKHLQSAKIRKKKHTTKTTLVFFIPPLILLFGSVYFAASYTTNVYTNPFDNLRFGASEKAWNKKLGPLSKAQLNLKDYELNPQFLAARILPDVKPTIDGKEPPTDYQKSQENLITLFESVQFPKIFIKGKWEDTQFSDPTDKNYTCGLSVVLDEMTQFAKQMKHKTNDQDQIKTFNYVVDQMCKLDIGQNNKLGVPRSQVQQNNLDTLIELLKEIPVVYRECSAILRAFNTEAITNLDLDSLDPISFPAQTYVYLKRSLKRYLEQAAGHFLIMERCKNSWITENEAKKYFFNDICRQHVVNELVYICRDELSFPGQAYTKEVEASYLTSYTSDPHQEIKSRFLTYFRQHFAETVFEELKAAVLESQYFEIPLKSYEDFAQKKGLKKEELYNDMCMALDPQCFLRVLVNIKILTLKKPETATMQLAS